MADILVKWLNEDVKLSKSIGPDDIAREFSNGYLFGELFHKFQLQDDLEKFGKTFTTNCKLNNFTRLEPTLRLLEIPFNTNLAKNVMHEKPGVATKLLYELYIALRNKQAANLTGTAMETMRPKAPKIKEEMNREYYRNRLKQINPRQSEIQLQELVAKWHEHKEKLLEFDMKMRIEDEKKLKAEQQFKRREAHDRSKKRQQEITDQVARILAAKVHFQKEPPNRTLKALEKKREDKFQRHVTSAINGMNAFENTLRERLVNTPDGDAKLLEYIKLEAENPNRSRISDNIEFAKPKSNAEYMQRLKRKSRDDATAKAEREKRRRKVVVDQLKQHEYEQEHKRDKQVIERLMRQSQLEKRIVTQLLQVRHEKAVILENRRYHGLQCEEQRQRDLNNLLYREEELLKQAKIDLKNEMEARNAKYEETAALRQQQIYNENYEACSKIISDMTNFACKEAEYRMLTENNIPSKLTFEWTSQFLENVSLFDEDETAGIRNELINKDDFEAYMNQAQEWSLPENFAIGSKKENRVFGFLLHRLYNLVYPPPKAMPPPQFPAFPMKLSLRGKPFSGLNVITDRLHQEFGFEVIRTPVLVEEAIEAFKNNETQLISSRPGSAAIVIDDIEMVDVFADVDAPKSESGIQATGESRRNSTLATPSSKTEAEGKILDSDSTLQAEKTTDASQKLSTIGDESAAQTWEYQLTPKAKCGQSIINCITTGQHIDDEILVELVVLAIRNVDETHGYVIENFPTNIMQAKLLENRLSGYVIEKHDPEKDPEHRGQLAKLVPYSYEVENKETFKAGLDLAIELHITDEESINRATEGEVEGVILQTEANANCMHNSLLEYVEQAEQLRSWFEDFQIFYSIDCNKSVSAAYLDVARLIDGTLQKRSKPQEIKEEPKVPEPEAPKDEVVPDENVPPSSAEDIAAPTEPAEPTTVEQPEETPAPRKGSRKQSGESRRSEDRPATGKSKRAGKKAKKSSEGKKEKKISKGKKAKKNTEVKFAKDTNRKKSRSRSGKRSTSGGKGKKGKKTPSPVPVPATAVSEPEVPEGPPPPQPGEPDWKYVEEALDMNVAKILVNKWENVEVTFTSSQKKIFENVRNERETFIRYIYGIRTDYQGYLRRPDHKQEFLTQCQIDLNSLEEDMRVDDETKCEWHQRIFQLEESLRDICEHRREDTEKERQAIISDGWLQDRVALLINHYISLLQLELDKFVETRNTLKNYYQAMEAIIPEKFEDYPRLPLLEIQAQEELKASRTSSFKNTPTNSAKVRSRRQSLHQSDDGDEQKPRKVSSESPQPRSSVRRIPLVSRRPASVDFLLPGQQPKKDQKKAAQPKKTEAHAESPMPPQDEDEKIMFDAHSFVIHAITSIMQAEQAAREAEEEAERQALIEKEKEKEKAAKAKDKQKDNEKKTKGKDKKNNSKKSKGKGKEKPTKGKGKEKPTKAAVKKGKGSAKKNAKDQPVTMESEPETVDENNEEMMRKREIKSKMRQEYFAALSIEEHNAKSRTELIKVRLFSTIQTLKKRCEETYEDMQQWLTERYRLEIQRCEEVCLMLAYAVETNSKIQEELILIQSDYEIRNDRLMFRPPPIPERPPPFQVCQPDEFSISQLTRILRQFQQSAPKGVISAKAFVDIISDLDALTFGQEALPEIWLSLTNTRIAEIVSSLAPMSEFVDWRHFLLAAAKPWPQPTQSQLLDQLAIYTNVDTDDTGYITKEQFSEIPLWFTEDTRPSTPEDPLEPFPYNRTGGLLTLFMEMFLDYSLQTPVIDYVKMLFYFCVDLNPVEGFMRALSVACQTHMPRISDPSLKKKQRVREKIVTGRSDLTPQMLDEELPPVDDTIVVNEDKPIEEHLNKSPINSIPPLDIPENAIDAMVPIDDLILVLQHGRNLDGDSNRFITGPSEDDSFSVTKIYNVYEELGAESDALRFTTLVLHPFIQDVISLCQAFKAPDLKAILSETE